MAPPAASLSDLLEAAMGVFFRFGFRKASMDDIAQAAGLSRQSLYLKFHNKEQLFEAALRHFVRALIAKTLRISMDDQGITAKITAIFEALHGEQTDAGSRSTAAELLDLARSRHGDLVIGFERDVTKIVADLLTREGIARRWAGGGLTAEQLARHLLMAASGIKASASAASDYGDRMSVAIALIVDGGPADASMRSGRKTP